MDIKTLRYFLAVAREENMTRAAELIHVTQPTLSKQLKGLEEELGKQLFIRHAFHIELTEEGQLLRKRAEDLVTMADKITNEFAAMDDVTGGDIYFGLAESYQIRLLAREIRHFKTMYPNLRYHITSGGTEQVLERLDKGILDFAILVETPDYKKYNVLEFPETDKWGIICPKNHPLAQKESIHVEDLIGLPLFCSEQSWNANIPRWAGNKMNELHLEGSFQLAYNGGIFASEGLGVLLAFDKIIDTSLDSDLTFRPLTPTLENKMYLVWKKFHIFSPIAEKFMMQMQESFLDPSTQIEPRK
ncbi:MAG: LysR family transcriptional regulator [Eubacteriales bacterium]|nr:LysR family transcriptional regulator [Eubacteriales bacterium]